MRLLRRRDFNSDMADIFSQDVGRPVPTPGAVLCPPYAES